MEVEQAAAAVGPLAVPSPPPSDIESAPASMDADGVLGKLSTNLSMTAGPGKDVWNAMSALADNYGGPYQYLQKHLLFDDAHQTEASKVARDRFTMHLAVQFPELDQYLYHHNTKLECRLTSGYMANQRVKTWPVFGLENASYRIAITSIGTKAVDCFSGKCHQTTTHQNITGTAEAGI